MTPLEYAIEIPKSALARCDEIDLDAGEVSGMPRDIAKALVMAAVASGDGSGVPESDIVAIVDHFERAYDTIFALRMVLAGILDVRVEDGEVTYGRLEGPDAIERRGALIGQVLGDAEDDE